MIGKQWQAILLGIFSWIALGTQAPAQSSRAAEDDGYCLKCTRIKIGSPHLMRGPAEDIGDNRFSFLRLTDGRFRGFDANGVTRAIDGASPWDMNGDGRIVLKRGAEGSYDACGQWIQHIEHRGDVLLGFVHNETACNYRIGQTHKSMSLALSKDSGETWSTQGLVISGSDVPAAGKNTGEGDCTFVDGHDDYYYAYCGRSRDGNVVSIRAPKVNPGPGHWMKYQDGLWNQPGLGGDASPLGHLGSSAAYWVDAKETILLGWQGGGISVHLSKDHVSFGKEWIRLLPAGQGAWRRPDPSEAVAYPVVLNADDGSNQLTANWMLVYAYWYPGAGPKDKYVVGRSISVSTATSPVYAHALIMLARWRSADGADQWSTTGVAIDRGNAYAFDKNLGYLLTSPEPGLNLLQLQDCVSRDGRSAHFLGTETDCEKNGFASVRLAGWAYAESQDGTQALYECVSADRRMFASNDVACEGKGSGKLLGYTAQ